jgi:lysozyme family protein
VAGGERHAADDVRRHLRGWMVVAAEAEATMTPNEIIDAILIREGGYVDHPNDRGGPTNFGVTQATLAEWRGRPVTADDVRNLTVGEARELYRDRYIVKPGFLAIENQQVRAHAVDCAVNHGPVNAVKMLQLAAHVFADGHLGPQTRAAVNRMTAAALYRRLCAERAKFYGQIITRDPSQSVFAAGWMARLAEFIESSP